MSSQQNIPAGTALLAGPSAGGPDLPKEYGVTRLVLMPMNPGWMHAYWEVAPYTWDEAERSFGPGLRSANRALLRLFSGDRNGRPDFEVEVQLNARNWYIQGPNQGGKLRAELGVLLPDGRFALLAVSNEVWVPTGRVSDLSDEKWGSLRAQWERLFELSGGGRLGAGSLDMVRALAQHWEFLGAVSSWPSGLGGASWPGSPRRAYGPAERPKDFWLIADCELVVYGATEPGARVSLQGREVPLNPDGTFSARLALPGGRLDIPVEAVNADKDRFRSLHFSITRDNEATNKEEKTNVGSLPRRTGAAI